jgi:cyclophilin family peptidyl-prolyl cis-trans isomerase
LDLDHIKVEVEMKRYVYLLFIILLISFACTENPRVVIVTNMGEIEIELNAEDAPKHTENFVKLVNNGFYAGTIFHRVVPGAIIQGGDPLSKDTNPANDGTGGPGYTLEAEIKLLHKRGSIASARLGDKINPKKESSGSQFYICLKDLSQLDKLGYTVFGKVVRGMETADKIGNLKIDGRQRPNRRIVIERVYED